MSLQKDSEIIRELARKVRELAESDRYVRMRQRFRDTNDLKIVRPPLLMDELPVSQLLPDPDLDCLCEDETLRGMEFSLRFSLYREKHFRCDNPLQPFWTVYKSFSDSGNGLSIRQKTIHQDGSPIVAHEYEDVLAEESALENFRMPVITAHPEKDEENVAFAREILQDILPVVLMGHQIYYAPWDEITMLRGVEPIMEDIYDRPEYLHRIIGKFTEAMSARMDQMESLGLYDSRNTLIHCTPADFTPKEPGTSGCRSLWFRTMAQNFSSISPAAHYEFDVQYSVPLASRCAYTYYGCCEPLHDRIDILKHYPNLRKVGCSPWADVNRTAEQLGGNYVLSRKPNPSAVCMVTDREQVRKEILETVQACRRYGCPCDFTLKDVSGINFRPQNLVDWAEAASGVLDEYYGEA